MADPNKPWTLAEKKDAERGAMGPDPLAQAIIGFAKKGKNKALDIMNGVADAMSPAPAAPPVAGQPMPNRIPR